MSTIVQIDWTAGGLRDQDVAPGAAIQASKVIHQTSHSKLVYGPTTTIAAISYPLTVVDAESAVIGNFTAVIFGAPTGDRTATIDLQKSTGGGAFATVLTSTITFNSSSAVRVQSPAVVLDTDLVEGDVLQAVVTVGGSTGTQPQGLLVSLTLRDRPVE